MSRKKVVKSFSILKENADYIEKIDIYDRSLFVDSLITKERERKKKPTEKQTA
jgi:hypothetical protein